MSDIVKRRFDPDYFNRCMNNLTARINDTCLSEETRGYYKRAAYNIMRFSAVRHEEVDETGKPSCVRITAAPDDYAVLVGQDGPQLVDNEIDYAAQLVEKLQNWWKTYVDECIRIADAYDLYMQSDETDARGKKTKRDFCRRNSITTDKLSKSISIRNEYKSKEETVL